MAITSATFTEQEGVKVTITEPPAKNVVEVDSSQTTTLDVNNDLPDETIVEIDTSSAAVDINVVELVPEGLTLRVINKGGTNQITFSGVPNYTFEGAATTGVAAADGAVAEVTHVTGGDVYVSGNVA